MFKKLILGLALSLLLHSALWAQEANNNTKNSAFLFSNTWCYYCKIVKQSVLPDPRVVKALSNYEYMYIDTDKHKSILPAWKIKTVPELVIGKRTENNRVVILGRWKPQNLHTSNRQSHEQNIRSLLTFLNNLKSK